MRVLGFVSYKGTNYQGWQKQNDVETIQGELESKLSQIFNQEINIFASGRTDAGVHAVKQSFHFDVNKEFDIQKVTYSLNRMLPNDIKILELKVVDDNFHARFSAKSKTYVYKIWLDIKDPFEKDQKYVYPFKIDMDLLKETIALFKGEHNFKNFTSKEEDEDNYVRKVFGASVSQDNKELTITFTGNGFMRYQIRDMVGAALAVASKQINKDYVRSHLDNSGPRDIVNYKAPPEGLYLLEVNY